jgi:hypothetical protein
MTSRVRSFDIVCVASMHGFQAASIQAAADQAQQTIDSALLAAAEAHQRMSDELEAKTKELEEEVLDGLQPPHEYDVAFSSLSFPIH